MVKSPRKPSRAILKDIHAGLARSRLQVAASAAQQVEDVAAFVDQRTHRRVMRPAGSASAISCKGSLLVAQRDAPRLADDLGFRTGAGRASRTPRVRKPEIIGLALIDLCLAIDGRKEIAQNLPTLSEEPSTSMPPGFNA